MERWELRGHYLKGCNCPTICACDTVGGPAPQRFCEAVLAMSVQSGHFGDVDLRGSKWVAVARWPGTLYDGDGTLELFADDAATDDQRRLLTLILTGQAGGQLFQILRAVSTTIYGPHFVPIHFEFNQSKRRAHVAIPEFLEMTTTPAIMSLTGEEQRVIIRTPGGFAFHEMEVARTGSVASTGAITFEWRNTHCGLASVEYADLIERIDPVP